MPKIVSRVLLLCTLFSAFLTTSHAQEAKSESSPKSSPEKSASSNGLMDFNLNESPTYIESDKLHLFSEKKLLQYLGNVHVIHEGMDLTCDTLDAIYNEENEIVKLIAKTNVYITKGESIRARSERAVYEKATEIMTLTENPELQQEKSILAADIIRIFLQEDRSEAEGDVRVKLIENKEEVQPQKLSVLQTATTSPTPSSSEIETETVATEKKRTKTKRSKPKQKTP